MTDTLVPEFDCFHLKGRRPHSSAYVVGCGHVFLHYLNVLGMDGGQELSANLVKLPRFEEVVLKCGFLLGPEP